MAIYDSFLDSAYDAALRSNIPASNYTYNGLSLSDSFGDELRELQKEAAAEQMAYQTQSAERAMQFSAEEAQKNRDFQEYMSSTSYQRARADMEKAGINPILAFSGGSSGASTPSGSSASGVAQSGSQARVSDENSALRAFETYVDALVSAGSLVRSFLK